MNEFGLRIQDSSNTLEPQEMSEAGADRIDLSKLGVAFRRQRRVILLGALVGLAIGVAYLVTTPRTYFAATSVMLDANVNRAVGELSAIEDGSTDSAMEGAMLIVRSQQLALRVVDALQLQDDPDFMNPPTSLLARTLGTVIGTLRQPLDRLRSRMATPDGEVAAAPPTADQIDEARRQFAALYLRGGLSVGREGRSSVLSIGYRSSDPQLAAAIANTFADAYAADVLNANFDATERTTDWMRSRLDQLETNALEASMAAEAFRNANGLVASPGGALLSEQNASQLNLDLADATAQAARARALLGNYEAALSGGPEGLARSGQAGGYATPGSGDTRLIDSQERLSALNARLRQIEQEFGVNHPQADAVRAQVALQADALYSEIGRARDDARGALDVAVARADALRESLGLAVEATSSDGSAQVQLRALEQRATTLDTLYQNFFARFEEIEQQKSFPISNVRVLSTAAVPRGAASPRTIRTLALMLVVGVIFASAIGLFREYRDWYFRTGEAIEDETGHRFLGYLPAIPDDDKSTVGKRRRRGSRIIPTPDTENLREVRHPVYAMRNPRSHFTETLQNVRFTMGVALAGKPNRIVGITSVLPGEGKTTVAGNLAGLTAASGASTLLIDCDQRNPGLSRSLRMLRGKGLVEAIMGEIHWRSALTASAETGLHILPCVAPPFATQVADLLGSPQMRTILEEASEIYTHIFLDLPPMGPVVDARMLLPYVDQALLVVEWGRTPKSIVRKTIERDHVLTDRLMGIILNKTNMDKLKNYAVASDVEHHYGDYGGYIS